MFVVVEGQAVSELPECPGRELTVLTEVSGVDQRPINASTSPGG